MAQEYGLPPVNQQPLDYVGWQTPIKPGGVFQRAPTTADTNYPIGFEWIYQVSASDTNIYCRVPDSGVWQFIESTAGGVVPVSEGGTGSTTLTNHGVLIGHGTSPVTGTSAGTSGQLLQSGGGSADPNWTTATFPATATQGDILYASANNVWTSLAKSTAVGAVLTNNGTSNAPQWSVSGSGAKVGFSNVGFTYSSSTFSVASKDGSALSATNAAQITFQSSATPGITKTLSVTANQGFIDATGASQIAGNLFGTTTGVAWAQDIPFFVYAVANSAAGSPETAITFMISRNPAAVSTSGATIANLGAATADAEVDFYSLANITVADYANSPAVWIGSFRMRKSAGDDWTVQAMTKQDGPGIYDETTVWVFPLGQNGADASNWFFGTAVVPIITAAGSTYNYWVKRNGTVEVLMNGLSLSTNGTGAGALKMALPITNNEGNIGNFPGSMTYLQNSKYALFQPYRDNTASSNYFEFLTQVPGSAGAAGDVLQCSSVTSAVDTITIICVNATYQGW